MLQDIRSSTKGTTAKIIIGLIVISFSIFGIESLLVGGGSSGVAEVNGETISAFELQQAVSMRQRQLMSLLGEDADPALLDDDRLSSAALDMLVQRRILIQAAAKAGLVVSEQQIGSTVAAMEDFQIDGRFSPELYQSLLSTAGYTPAVFKQSLREDLLLEQLRGGLAASEFTTPLELRLAALVAEEQRDLRYLVLPVDEFEASVVVEDEAVQEYYTANQTEFMSPESVSVRFIELRTEQFVQPVPESRLREEFELSREQFEYATENRVAHILFERAEDESAQAFAERISAAQSALADGEAFAELAIRFSDDIGSADFGGDLGFSAGDAFPAEMEEAIAQLAVGEVSGPVETDAGTHLIKLLERRDGTQVSFEQVRPELEQRIAQTEARAELLRNVEALRDLVFNADDLEVPAQNLGVSVQRNDDVQRNQREGLFAAPRLQSVVFSPEVLEQGYNSEVIELSPDQFLVVRVADYREPAVRPVEEVREQIVAQLAMARATDAARNAAEDVVQRLGNGEAMDAIASELNAEWQVELGLKRDAATLPAGVLRQVFQMPDPQGGEAPQRSVISGLGGDLYVVELMRVREGSVETLADIRRQQLTTLALRENAGRVQREYEAVLRADAEVTLY